jgi:hypothetical protein
MDSSLPDSNFVPGKERYFNGQLIAGFQFCTRQGVLFIWTAHCRIPIWYPARSAIYSYMDIGQLIAGFLMSGAPTLLAS